MQKKGPTNCEHKKERQKNYSVLFLKGPTNCEHKQEMQKNYSVLFLARGIYTFSSIVAKILQKIGQVVILLYDG